MAITPLTINRLDEDGLAILATTNILENVEGVGTGTVYGNSFVNTKKTHLVLYALGHTATVVFTIVPPVATLQTGQYGELDVDDIVITLAISTVAQMAVVQIPAAYNTAGKALIKATSASAFEAGEVKIAAIELGL